MGRKNKRKKPIAPARPAGKGLKAVRTPDVASRMGIADAMPLRGVTGVPGSPAAIMGEAERRIRQALAKPAVDLELAMAGLSDEERAFVEGKRWAQKLTVESERVRQTLGAMIAFRRLYVVAYRELQEALAEHEGVHPATEDMLMQSAMHAAAKTFDEHQLMQGVFDTIMPWVAGVVDKHVEADKEAAKADAEIEEAERKARPVPLGFIVGVDDASDLWPRDRQLVFVGWENAVRFVIDRIIEHVLNCGRDKEQSFCVLRLLDKAPTDRDADPRLVRVTPDAWKGCCNNGQGIAKLMGGLVERLPQLPDLMACEDMRLAYTAGFFGRAAGADAGDALKGFKKWCVPAGSAFVGGVPLAEEELPDLRVAEYEQLRAFATLRGVRVSEAKDGVRKVSIDGGLHSWEVDEQTLNAYGHSRLLLPAGVR